MAEGLERRGLALSCVPTQHAASHPELVIDNSPSQPDIISGVSSAEYTGLSEMEVLPYQHLSDSEFTTLHSDGTTKYGQHCGSFQVTVHTHQA